MNGEAPWSDSSMAGSQWSDSSVLLRQQNLQSYERIITIKFYIFPDLILKFPSSVYL